MLFPEFRLDAAVLRCCLFPVYCSCFTKNIETRVVVVYSCCWHKISIHYGCSTTSTELAFGSDSRACDVTNPCSSRNFLKAAVLHYFPSGVERCFWRFTPLFTYGNIQRLEQLHLRLNEISWRSLSCKTSLTEWGRVHLKKSFNFRVDE